MEGFLSSFEKKQELVQELLGGNAMLMQEIAKIDLEIEAANHSKVEWDLQATPLLSPSEALAERASLEVLENRILLLEKKIRFLRLERAALVNAKHQRDTQLLADAQHARERFHSSIAQMQARKAQAHQQNEARNHQANRMQMEIQLLSESIFKHESELKGTNEATVQIEQQCQQLMEDLAHAARAKRAKLTQFDIAKAFADQQHRHQGTNG
ncbi:hypothetical protein BASA81_002006 [Batrachochytrium salamandrivorans]|nr:hypothetical protein BASA81_002006 [Batrachochytrium salamandrivorans]